MNNEKKIISIILTILAIILAVKLVKELLPIIIPIIIAIFVYNLVKGKKANDKVTRNIEYEEQNYNIPYFNKEREKEEMVVRSKSVKDDEFFNQRHEVKDAKIVEE